MDEQVRNNFSSLLRELKCIDADLRSASWQAAFETNTQDEERVRDRAYDCIEKARDLLEFAIDDINYIIGREQ